MLLRYFSIMMLLKKDMLLLVQPCLLRYPTQYEMNEYNQITQYGEMSNMWSTGLMLKEARMTKPSTSFIKLNALLLAC